jgi:hypothetical protein
MPIARVRTPLRATAILRAASGWQRVIQGSEGHSWRGKCHRCRTAEPRDSTPAKRARRVIRYSSGTVNKGIARRSRHGRPEACGRLQWGQEARSKLRQIAERAGNGLRPARDCTAGGQRDPACNRRLQCPLGHPSSPSRVDPGASSSVIKRHWVAGRSFQFSLVFARNSDCRLPANDAMTLVTLVFL